MKAIIFLVFWASMGAFTVNRANAETVVIVDNKAYQVVEIDGKQLVSNEWQPTNEDGYTDEYLSSEQYQVIKDANISLRKIKDGSL